MTAATKPPPDFAHNPTTNLWRRTHKGKTETIHRDEDGWFVAERNGRHIPADELTGSDSTTLEGAIAILDKQRARHSR